MIFYVIGEVMNVVSIETKLVLFKKFSLFTEMLVCLSESKKQIKYVKRIIYSECKNINDREYILSEKDAAEVDVYISDLKEIALRFAKAKNTENYNRAKELLNRFNQTLENAIKNGETERDKEKHKGFLHEALKKGREIERTVVDAASAIKAVVNSVKGGKGDS